MKLAISGGTLTITSLPLLSGQVGQVYHLLAEGEGRGPSLHLCYRPEQSPARGFDAVQWNDFRYPYNCRKLHRRPVGHRLRKQHSLATCSAGHSRLWRIASRWLVLFEFSGTGPHGAIALNGGFLIQATSAVGFYDENIGSTGSVTNQSIGGITLVPGTNGLSQLKLQLAGGASVTFALAAPASIVTSGNDTAVRMIELMTRRDQAPEVPAS